MNRLYGFFSIALLLSIPLMTGCSGDEEVVGNPNLTPDFILTDLDGVDFHLSSHFGEVVLLDFFKPT